MTTVFCFHCKAQNRLLEKKVPFRAECFQCSSDLHVCKNCAYYSVGKPNDCLIPDTEPVYDREKHNFCEEFMPGQLMPAAQKNIKDIEKELFD
ncbi:MAG: hypothetical protein JW769_04810 [Parachlamydiales bacterium]|nr:hypothetical protein [Parachlamydiales bacterium]